nr:MAG: RNA-dependent RNA polymerase [Avian associated picorna-like virus 42]
MSNTIVRLKLYIGKLSLSHPIGCTVAAFMLLMVQLFTSVSTWPVISLIYICLLCRYVLVDSFKLLKDSIRDMLGRKPTLSTIIEKAQYHPCGLMAMSRLLLSSRTIADFTSAAVGIASLLGFEETVVSSLLRRFYESPPLQVQALDGDSIRRLAGPVAMLIGVMDPTQSSFGKAEEMIFKANRCRTSSQALIDSIVELMREYGLVSDPESDYLTNLRSRIDKLRSELEWMENLREVSLCSFGKHENSQRALSVFKMLDDLIAEGTRYGYKGLSSSNIGRIFTQLLSIQGKYKEVFGAVRRTILETSERVRPVGVCLFGPSKLGKSNMSTELERLVKLRLFQNARQPDATPLMKVYGDANEWTSWNQNTRDKYDTGYKGNMIHRIDDAFQDAKQEDHIALINQISNVPIGTDQADLGDKGRPYTAKLVIVSCNSLPNKSATINCVDALHNRFPICIRCESFRPMPQVKDHEFSFLKMYSAPMSSFAGQKAERLSSTGKEVNIHDIVTQICQAMYQNLELYNSTVERTTEIEEEMNGEVQSITVRNLDRQVIENIEDDRLSFLTTATYDIGDTERCFPELVSMLQTVNLPTLLKRISRIVHHSGYAMPRACLIRCDVSQGVYLFGSDIHRGRVLIRVPENPGEIAQNFNFEYLDIDEVNAQPKHARPRDVVYSNQPMGLRVSFRHLMERYPPPQNYEPHPPRVVAEQEFSWIDSKLKFLDDAIVQAAFAVANLLRIPVSPLAETIIHEGSKVLTSKWFIGGVLGGVLGYYTLLKIQSGLADEPTIQSRNPVRRLKKRAKKEKETQSRERVKTRKRLARPPKVDDPKAMLKYINDSMVPYKQLESGELSTQENWECSIVEVDDLEYALYYNDAGNFCFIPEVDEPMESECFIDQFPKLVNLVVEDSALKKYTAPNNFFYMSKGSLSQSADPNGFISFAKSLNESPVLKPDTPRFLRLELDRNQYPTEKRWALQLTFWVELKDIDLVFSKLQEVNEFESFDCYGSLDLNSMCLYGWITTSSTKSLDVETLLQPTLINLDEVTEVDSKKSCVLTQSVDDSSLELLHNIIEKTNVAVFMPTNNKNTLFSKTTIWRNVYTGFGVGEYIFTLAHGGHEVGDVCMFTRLGRHSTKMNYRDPDGTVFKCGKQKRLYGRCISVNKKRDTTCFRLMPVSTVVSIAKLQQHPDINVILDCNPIFPMDLEKHFNTEESIKQMLSEPRDIFIWAPTGATMSQGIGQMSKYVLNSSGEQLHFDGIEAPVSTLTAPTQAGDCGGMYFIANPRFAKKMLGLHHGGSPQSVCAYGTYFTSDMYYNMTKKTGDTQMVNVEEPFDRECDLEAIRSHIPPTWINRQDDIMFKYLDDSSEGPDVPHGTGCRGVGTTAFTHRPQGSGKSKCNVRSPFFGCFEIVRFEPPFSYKDRRIRTELPRNRDGVPSLTLRANNAMGIEVPSINTELLNQCLSQMIEVWTMYVGRAKIDQKDVDLEGMINLALNGRLGNEYVKGVVLNKSAGLPWTAMQGSSRKSDFIAMNEHGTRYLKDNEAASVLRKVLERKFTVGKQGKRMLSFQACSLKDQCIKQKHVEAGKVRVFYPTPFEDMIYGKALFGDFWEFYQKEWQFFRNTITINELSHDWTELAHSIMRHSNYMDLDFAEWDKHAPAEFIFAAYSLVIEVIDNKTSDGWKDARYVHAYNMIRSIMVDGRTAFMTEHSVKSGSSDTTPINSIIGVLYLFYVFSDLTGIVDYEVFNSNVTSFHNGDDMVISVSDEYADIFNYNTLVDAFSRIGLIATPGMKGEFTGKPFSSFDTLTFLKRKFKWDYDICLSPLDEESIIARFGFTKNSPNDVQEWIGIVRSALDEWWLHGREMYESHRVALQQWMNKPGFPRLLIEDLASVLCKDYDTHSEEMRFLFHDNQTKREYVENLGFPSQLADYISEHQTTLLEALSDLDVVNIGIKVDEIEATLVNQQSQIADLGRNIDSVDRRVGRVESLYDTLNVQVELIQGEVDELKQTVMDVDEQVTTLTTNVLHLNDEITSINNQLDDIRTQTDSNTVNITNLDESIAEIQSTLVTQQDEIRTLRTAIFKCVQVGDDFGNRYIIYSERTSVNGAQAWFYDQAGLDGQPSVEP